MAPARSSVASQSTIAPVSFSQTDLTASKLSNSGPLHRPRTRTCSPWRPCEAELVAHAVTVAVVVAGAGGEPSELEQLTARAVTSMRRPATRLGFGRIDVIIVPVVDRGSGQMRVA